MTRSPLSPNLPLNVREYYWFAPHFYTYSWKQYQDALILLHPLSAKTHILNELAFELLQELGKKSATRQELIVTLGLEEEDQAEQIIHHILSQLDQSGLIVPIPP
ncbi:MAG: HPr-rel-A system PqqD family peptide chaperone [Magnetococcus sp. DMHC-6]